MNVTVCDVCDRRQIDGDRWFEVTRPTGELVEDRGWFEHVMMRPRLERWHVCSAECLSTIGLLDTVREAQ